MSRQLSDTVLFGVKISESASTYHGVRLATILNFVLNSIRLAKLLEITQLVSSEKVIEKIIRKFSDLLINLIWRGLCLQKGKRIVIRLSVYQHIDQTSSFRWLYS